MKPNVFLLTIDSLRADKVFGNTKTSLTPNIDNLIKNGIYFTQTISSADGTGTSAYLGSTDGRFSLQKQCTVTCLYIFCMKSGKVCISWKLVD